MYIIKYDFIHKENYSFTRKTDHKFTPSSIHLHQHWKCVSLSKNTFLK